MPLIRRGRGVPVVISPSARLALYAFFKQDSLKAYLLLNPS